MTTVVVAALGAMIGLVGVGVGCRHRRRSPDQVLVDALGSADRAPNASLSALSPWDLWAWPIPSSGRQGMGSDIGTKTSSDPLQYGQALGNPWWQRMQRRWAVPMAQQVAARSAVAAQVEPALYLIGMSWPQLGGQMVAGACSGLALSLVLVALWSLATSGGAGVLLGAAVVMVTTGAGALIPLAVVCRSGAQRRQAAVTSVASYVDLVVLCLAGGMGIESALHQAAKVAEDRFSSQISAVLAVGGHSGRPPWQALAQLGEATGVGELVELANAISLAGTEGARVRASLTAKADTLRRRQLARAESAANAMTERLFLPGALVLMGFLIFIGYPALARIMSGLS